MGRTLFLLKDEEVIIVATAEIKGAHGHTISHKQLASQVDHIFGSLDNNPR